MAIETKDTSNLERQKNTLAHGRAANEFTAATFDMPTRRTTGNEYISSTKSVVWMIAGVVLFSSGIFTGLYISQSMTDILYHQQANKPINKSKPTTCFSSLDSYRPPSVSCKMDLIILDELEKFKSGLHLNYTKSCPNLELGSRYIPRTQRELDRFFDSESSARPYYGVLSGVDIIVSHSLLTKTVRQYVNEGMLTDFEVHDGNSLMKNAIKFGILELIKFLVEKKNITCPPEHLEESLAEFGGLYPNENVSIGLYLKECRGKGMRIDERVENAQSSNENFDYIL